MPDRLPTSSPASPSPAAGYMTANHLTGESLRLAAIDVGSNSIHMIVAQIDPDGGVTTLWRLKEPTGLGRMTFPSRRISNQSMDRALATLARFKHAARQRSAEKIVAVATSAVREAHNGGDLIERAWRELRLRIRVVNAPEEARLIYLGVRHAGALDKQSDEPALVIDIGGGSVEFCVGTNERALLLESRKLGAARMTARFVHSDPISEADLTKLRKHYDKELGSLATQIKTLSPTKVVGTSGTLENIAAMCAAMTTTKASSRRVSRNGTKANDRNGTRPTTPAIEADPLRQLYEQIVTSTAKQRAEMPGLDDARRDQIVAGIVLVHDLFEKLNIERLELCGSALREGILIDYFERKLPKMAIRREVPDPRRRSVLDLCRRCHWHKEHSEKVTQLTMQLFDQLQGLHHLGPLDRELIEYACLMHDIGWHIDGKKHHKHAMYLIQHGKLRDFTPEEVAIMANIARYHRKALPEPSHDAYAQLPQRSRRIVDVGSALLRVADGLDRSHGGVVRSVTCEVKPKKVVCHLHTRADAELEIWGAKRKADLFEKVFERPLTLQGE